MKEHPTALKLLDDQRLWIAWSDGQERTYPFAELRDACPCATCREKRNAEPDPGGDLLPVLAPAEAVPLAVVGMKPVGNYAYSIAFTDGHDTGIFTFELLRQLGSPTDPS